MAALQLASVLRALGAARAELPEVEAALQPAAAASMLLLPPRARVALQRMHPYGTVARC